MEGFIGSIVAVALSFGYTEMKLRKQRKDFADHIERVNAMEQTHARNMIASMMPITKSVKELQEFTGIR